MYLQTPPTYLSVADFKAQPNDQDISPYSDSQLSDLLVRASAVVDSIMRRSFLPQEVTETFSGDGSNVLSLDTQGPIIYVNSVELVLPGYAPFSLPLGQLFIDYKSGYIKSYSTMIWRSLGVSAAFPNNNLPIVVNYARGKGFPIPAPSFSLSAGPGGGTLSVGSLYDVAVTSRTQSGESLPATTQTFTVTSTGSISVTVTPQPGALLHRVYIAAHGQPLLLVGETPATSFSASPFVVSVTSLTPPGSLRSVPAPTADTSAWPLENSIVEATRILALSMLWEQNNLANRGISLEVSKDKRIQWRPSDGNSAKGVPGPVQQADLLLSQFKACGIL